MMCLGLGILSTVMACAVTPHAMTPPATPPPEAPPPVTAPLLPGTPSPAAPEAVTPPAPPPSEVFPAVAPPAVRTSPPYIHPPSPTGNRGSDIDQVSPYGERMDEKVLEYRRRCSAQEQEQEGSAYGGLLRHEAFMDKQGGRQCPGDCLGTGQQG